MSDELADGLCALRGISLAELDERAALMRRVDRKYVLERGGFLEFLDGLRDDHEVLEIDGRRSFAYRSVYFDTADLRCFWEHVHGRVPRFKARTRLYRDTGSCVFEVKLKRSEEQMDKRQTEHPVEHGEDLTEAARECLREALSAAGLAAPRDLVPSLFTEFRRITLAASGSSERLTCDLDVRLSSPAGSEAALARSLVLLEAKTDPAVGRANDALDRLGVKEVSLSKYRVGISLVGGASIDNAQPGSELFAVR